MQVELSDKTRLILAELIRKEFDDRNSNYDEDELCIAMGELNYFEKAVEMYSDLRHENQR